MKAGAFTPAIRREGGEVVGASGVRSMKAGAFTPAIRFDVWSRVNRRRFAQ